jgi:hypothetical protein
MPDTSASNKVFADTTSKEKIDKEQTKQRLEKLAWLLDNSIKVPGLGFRVGLDGIVGLIPGIGDAVGSVLSSYILAEAARLGVSKLTLMHMGFNILIDAVVGLIPFVGDLFDFAWKSNQKNIELLQKHIESPPAAKKSDRLIAWVLLIIFLLALIGVIYLGFSVIGWFIDLLVG